MLTGSSTSPTATVTATVLPIPPDAVPLTSTLTNLPAPPTGTFTVSLQDSVSNDNTCLNEDESCAWDCATGADLNMIVTMAASNVPAVSLNYLTPSDGLIYYGSQPPQLNQPAPLVLMNDKDDAGKGPAYVFQQPYDKLVIVHEGDLPGGVQSSKRSFIKRWLYGDGPESLRSLTRRQENDENDEWTSQSIVKPGDKPWFCYWNNTILEGFIFVTQDANASASASDASPSAAATSSGTNPIDGSRLKRHGPASPSYPKSVKIEERRPLKPSQPYCQQMQILNTLQPGALLNPDTHSVNTVYLNETGSQSLVQNEAMPGMAGIPHFAVPASPTNIPTKRGAMHKRTTSPSTCQCKWMDG